MVKGVRIRRFSNDTYPDVEMDDTDLLKRVDVGLTGGIGCGFPIRNNLTLTAEVRHHLGVRNISKESFWIAERTSSTNLLIGVAYQFGM